MQLASITGAALSGLIALTGCTDDMPPTITTNPVWIDPIISGVGIRWTAASTDCGFGEHSCLQNVLFTVTHIECEGCLLGADQTFTEPFIPSTTSYDEGLGIAGLPFGVGPITITVTVAAHPEVHTLTATAVGDRVSGIRTECWTAVASAFPPLGTRCGATRTPGDELYIVPIVQTVNHGEFYLRDDGLVPTSQPGGDPLRGYFRLPEVTPAKLRWGFVLTTPNAQAPAITVPADDTTTTEVSLRVPLALGDEVSVTAAIPPFASRGR